MSEPSNSQSEIQKKNANPQLMKTWHNLSNPGTTLQTHTLQQRIKFQKPNLPKKKSANKPYEHHSGNAILFSWDNDGNNLKTKSKHFQSF